MHTLCLHSLLLVALVGLQAACAQPRDPDAGRTPSAAAPYAFDRPVAVFELHGDLDEISGLTVLTDRLLGAVQDEDGELFVVEMATGKVRSDAKFGRDGDYEGVEYADGRVFVLESDGDLFEIEDWQADDLDGKRHETRLKRSCDAEGLAYDPAGGRLLIACKEDGGVGRGRKAVYAYDLAEGRVAETPAYVIDTRAVTRSAPDPDALNRRLRTMLEPVADLSGFKPSALAVHPVTGEIYVLSSVRKVVVVLAPDGAIAGAWTLPEDLFPQPEGIAFLPDGDLFICSEAAGRKRGTLLRFAYER